MTTLADQRRQLVQMLSRLDRFSRVSTRVVNRSGDDLVRSLRALEPVLAQLDAAGNDLPDAIAAAPLNAIQQFSTDDLLDTDAAAAVVEALGADTFSERALELTRDGDTQLSVPSDGWAQLLFYRTDPYEDEPEAPFQPSDLLNPTKWMPADRQAHALQHFIEAIKDREQKEKDQE